MNWLKFYEAIFKIFTFPYGKKRESGARQSHPGVEELNAAKSKATANHVK